MLLLLAAAAYPNELRVLESNERAVTVELATEDYAVDSVFHGGEQYYRVRASGYGLTTEPGLPSLPLKGALLGVPFGAELSLEILSVDSEALGPRRVEPAPEERIINDGEMPVPIQKYAADETFYGGRGTYPRTVAELGFDATLRHQRVVQVVFHPFQYSAATGELAVHSRIVVRVNIRSGGRVPGLRPVLVDEREWEAVYRGTILNYEQAKSWRARPAPRREGGRPDFREDHELYRIEVGESGIYRLDFADLAEEGLSGTLDIQDVAVFERSFVDSALVPFVRTPLPILVVDADEDGVFDGNDRLYFYAQSYEDQFVVEGYEDRYDTGNVYWFGWGDGLAARMTSRPGWLGAAGLEPPATFRDTLRFEEDVYFDSTPPSDYVDLYHWTDYTENGDRYELPFEVYGIDPSGEAALRARYQGISSDAHRIDFTIMSGPSDTSEHWIGYFEFSGAGDSMDDHIYFSGGFPADYLTEGENVLRTVGSEGPGGKSGANLDWFELSYARRYEAKEGRLGFTNAGLTDTSQFEVTGFGSEAILLFDVTDPWNPVEIELGPENVETDDGAYRLVFQDRPEGFTRYEAVEETSCRRPASVERRVPANLYASEADLIVISPGSMAAAVEPLVAHREEQGLVVAVALLDDVYDEFGGGLPGPEPIRDYLMYAYEEWERQPQFALLIGDASEDTKGVLSSSSPNFMPTYLYVGTSNDKIVASDQWFVRGEDPTHLPVMFIGRLPAGGSGQLENFVSKILSYENYSSNDEWRNNVLFIADDQWSYVSLEANYTKKAYESEFEDVSLELADVVASSPSGSDTTMFLLSSWTDPWHGGTTSGDIWYAFETAQFVRGEGARSHLIGQISDGAVIVNFQGHGNRSQLTHEQLIMATSGSLNDIPLFNNAGMPFIFLGFSCELARFHDSREGSSIDCVTEQMLQRPEGKGAVATFACSGPAFMGPNALLNERIFEAFFTDPTPEGPPSSYFWPRWSLGGTIAKGMVKYLTDQGYPSAPQTYVLFGDPYMHVDMSPPTIRVTVDGEPRVSGDYIEATPEGETVVIVADIVDEVEIDPATISIVESDVGTVDPSEYELAVVSDTTSEQSRWYRLTYETEVREWSYDIKISATDVNGQSATFKLHATSGEAILIRDVANHPNPFDDSTNIIYLLNHSRADVTIRIFTVAGRLVRVIENAPNDVNYNHVEWDGRDQDGDPVASGIYLYVIDAKADDGSTATTAVGRMAKIGGLGRR